MVTVSVSLPDPMRDFVEAQARKEGFATVSEYLHSLLREVQRREARQALDAKLQAGLESGPSTPLTSEEWDDIEREGIELAARRRRGG